MKKNNFTLDFFADHSTSRISKELLFSVANFEGYSEKPYRCPSGVLTIGFGHTSRVTSQMIVPPPAAKAILYNDLALVYDFLSMTFSSFPNLPECYRNMLIDLGFNCGTSYFSSNTELRTRVGKVVAIFSKKGNVYEITSDGLLRTVLRYSHSKGHLSPGLLRRRYYYVKQCILWHEKNGYLK